MRLGIIGGTGWLGSALARGLLEAGIVAPEELVILNRSGPQPERFGRPVVWAGDAADLVRQSDIVVVSVRPEQWPALGLRAEGRLLVSFMAGVPLAALSATGARAVRAMPNAAAAIGASYSPWLPAADVTDADRQTVSLVLSAIGTSDELASEDQIDLMTAVSGSGPAYPALMAQAMMDFLRERGVAEAIARRATEAIVCSAAQLLAGRIETAPDLVRTFIDYAGTTAAGLQTAERAGFGAALQAGLEAATTRASDMADRR